MYRHPDLSDIVIVALDVLLDTGHAVTAGHVSGILLLAVMLGFSVQLAIGSG